MAAVGDWNYGVWVQLFWSSLEVEPRVFSVKLSRPPDDFHCQSLTKVFSLVLEPLWRGTDLKIRSKLIKKCGDNGESVEEDS